MFHESEKTTGKLFSYEQPLSKKYMWKILERVDLVFN